MKTYDEAYFERWYHNKRTRVNSKAEVRRKVMLAVTMAEYFLRRTVRTVLDIGCGEGAWREHLRAIRPRISYSGLDSSDYVVERFGASRNIRKAAFGDLPHLGLLPFDLVVCADMLHYVPNAELRPGIAEIARICEGLAYIEVLTSEDDVVGDLDAFHFRPAAWYRKTFEREGMRQAGPYCWLSPALEAEAAELEIVR